MRSTPRERESGVRSSLTGRSVLSLAEEDGRFPGVLEHALLHEEPERVFERGAADDVRGLVEHLDGNAIERALSAIVHVRGDLFCPALGVRFLDPQVRSSLLAWLSFFWSRFALGIAGGTDQDNVVVHSAAIGQLARMPLGGFAFL